MPEQKTARPPRAEEVMNVKELTSYCGGEYVFVGKMSIRSFYKYERPDHKKGSRFGFFYLTPAEYEILGKPERIEVDTVIRKK